MPHYSYRFGPERRREKLEPLRPPLRPSKASPRDVVGYPPIIAGGLTVISDSSGLVLALDSNGKIVWSYPLEREFDPSVSQSGSCAWTEDRLYLLDGGQLVVLDGRTGRTLARPEVAEADPIKGAAIGGALVTSFLYGSEDTYRIGRFDPEMRWSLPTDNPTATLAAGEGCCVYQPDRQSIAAAALDSGEELWRSPAGGLVVSAPIIWEGGLFLGVRPRTVFRLDLKTGKQTWRRELEIDNPSNLTLDPAGILELCIHPWHYSLDARTGETIRSHDFSRALEEFSISMVLDMDLSRTHIWAAEFFGRIFAMHRQTGRIDWVQSMEGRIPAGHYPIVHDGTLLFLDGRYRLHAFEKDK